MRIGCADGYLFADERPLLGVDRAALRLLPLLEALGAGGIALGPDVRADDLRALLALASRRDLQHLDIGAANQALSKEGARDTRFLEAYSASSSPSPPESCTDSSTASGPKTKRGVKVAGGVYDEVFEHLSEVMLRFLRGEVFFFEETKSIVERILVSLKSNAATVFSASQQITSRSDLFQFRHSIRVGCLAVDFARALTNDEALMFRIGAAAVLHDVGKRDVPPEVLRCPGRLEGEMLEAMRRHPELGARLLMQMPDADPLAVAIAFGHHRRGDHEGYPEAVHRAELSAATRIIKICDVYEALTSKRPYKPGMPPRRAFRVMIAMEGHFDLALLHRFILQTGLWPVGSRVKFESGATARVVGQTGHLDLPIVVMDGEEVPLNLRTIGDSGPGRITALAREYGNMDFESQTASIFVPCAPAVEDASGGPGAG